MTLSELRKVRPLGRVIADWLQEIKASEVSWYKNKHGHVEFTLDGKKYTTTFSTSPRCADEACKRAIIQLKKQVGVW